MAIGISRIRSSEQHSAYKNAIRESLAHNQTRNVMDHKKRGSRGKHNRRGSSSSERVTESNDDSTIRLLPFEGPTASQGVEFASGPISLSSSHSSRRSLPSSTAGSSSSNEANLRSTRAGTSGDRKAASSRGQGQHMCPHCRKMFVNSWSVPVHISVSLNFLVNRLFKLLRLYRGYKFLPSFIFFLSSASGYMIAPVYFIAQSATSASIVKRS